MAVSKGNSKIGNVPNVSLPPIKACGNCNSCRNHCYALKSYRMYPSVKKSWDENLDLYIRNPEEYFSMIRKEIKKLKSMYFRWHVSGDIMNQAYLQEMIAIAEEFPKVSFLCFTKMFDLRYQGIPENLQIIFSVFPSMERLPQGFRRAFVQDGTETRIPKDALHCPGLCDNCMFCFHDNKKDVYFSIH